MRFKQIGVVAAGVVLGVAVMGGCSKVEPTDLKAELEKKGMSKELSTCIVDGLVAKGVPLENYSKENPSADDSAKLTEVTTECVTKNPGGVPGS